MNINHTNIKQRVETLATRGLLENTFGAESHEFMLNQPLTEDKVGSFEVAYKIVLPTDYKTFLTQIGNGGAGPAYGVFKLGEMDDSWDHKSWEENDGFIGILSLPFPHSEAWNDLHDRPDYDIEDEELLKAQIEVFEERYFDSSLVNGAIPICHFGCDIRHWLVISGSETGNVWCDDRANTTGIYPLQTGKKHRMSFMEWYLEWLEDAEQTSNQFQQSQ